MVQRDSRHIADGRRGLVSPKERAPRESENAYRQAVRLEEMIEAAVGAKRFDLKPSTLMELNRLAVEGLVPSPGRYRLGAIEIEKSKHEPPEPDAVPKCVDELCDYVNSHWDLPPLRLAAYTMWMICWIHPFEDGNGRTARAASYLVLCARLKRQLPGEKTIPDQLVEDKGPYYAALEDADSAYAKGKIRVKQIEELFDRLLVNQVRDAATASLESRYTTAAMSRNSVALVSRREGMSPAVKGALIVGAATVLAAVIGAVKCGMG